jgi:PiT family inorganic phosphate transporter
VAQTIATGLVAPALVTQYVVVSALTGAIAWNIITWYYGIPSSSSHALIGGILGAAVAEAGFGAPMWGAVVQKVILPLIVSPILGFAFAWLLIILLLRLLRHHTPSDVQHRFGRLQLLSSAFMAFSHGGNDAQKTMGIIAVLLYSQGQLGSEFYVPFWVVISCQAALALGTLLGGWKIVHTMGQRITRLTPMQGFCAETGGAMTLFLATWLGIPVSTTHTITGAIVGVGAARRTTAVRWGVARHIVVAWVLTLPMTALISAETYLVTAWFTG